MVVYLCIVVTSDGVDYWDQAEAVFSHKALAENYAEWRMKNQKPHEDLFEVRVDEFVVDQDTIEEQT